MTSQVAAKSYDDFINTLWAFESDIDPSKQAWYNANWTRAVVGPYPLVSYPGRVKRDPSTGNPIESGKLTVQQLFTAIGLRDFYRRAALWVIAPRRIRKGQADPIGKCRGFERCLKFRYGFVQFLTGAQLANKRESARPRHRNKPTALDMGDQQGGRANQSMRGAGMELCPVRPDAREQRVRCLQRIAPQFRRAKIGGFASNLDVRNEKTNLCGINIKVCRLDINRKIGFWNGASSDSVHQIAGPRAHTAARLAAFLIADKSQGQTASNLKPRAPQQPNRRNRSTDTALQIAGPAPPDRAIFLRCRKGIAAGVRFAPEFCPTARMDGIAMADNHQVGPLCPAPQAPDIFAPLKESPAARVQPQLCQLVFKEAHEGGFVASHAVDSQSIPKQAQVGLCLLRLRQQRLYRRVRFCLAHSALAGPLIPLSLLGVFLASLGQSLGRQPATPLCRRTNGMAMRKTAPLRSAAWLRLSPLPW